MNGKHTPGPWVIDDEGHIRAPYPNHAPGISVARMTCFGAHDVHMAKDANARLISAAPDMLEALRYIVEWKATGWDPEKARDMATAAIRKATGGEGGAS